MRFGPCNSARQFVGKKGWLGFAQGFNFPGFRACWQDTYTYTDGYPFKSGTNGWISTTGCTGGALTGSGTTFNQGDLVVVEWPSMGPIPDFLTGLNQSYPVRYRVYVCIVAFSVPSTVAPYTDTTHFQAWDYQAFGFPSGHYADRGTDDDGGPSGWPMSMGGRLLGSYTTDTAHLEVTITTELSNFPLYPTTLSGLTALFGSSNDTADTFPAGSNFLAQAASGTFSYDWTFPTRYDGATPTYTAPGTTPSASQAHALFPIVPVGWGNFGSGDARYDGTDDAEKDAEISLEVEESGGVISSVLTQNAGPIEPAHLVTWNFTSTVFQMEFAAWSWGGSPQQLASAPATITQTITLAGATYSLTDVASDAEALRDAVDFGSINWGQSFTNTWNSSGGLVSTANSLGATGTQVTAGCAVGTEIKFGAAVNGLNLSPGTDIGVVMYCSKCQVQMCGNYCQRDYACPTVTCTNHHGNGVTPDEYDTPGTVGDSTGLYPGCSC